MKKRIYLLNSGRIEREANTLAFSSNSKKSFIPINNVSSLYAFGEIDINKRALEFLTQYQIPIHFFNFYGYYIGSYIPRRSYNAGIVTLRQAQHYLDAEKRLYLARQFVKGSISNILVILAYYNNRGVDLNATIDYIKDTLQMVENSKSINELMGMEGNVKESYYSAFNKICDDDMFVYDGRSRRPPATRLNSLISFGNTLLYTLILGEIYKTHLDPRIGYLHSTNNRKFSLNLDIAEIFKPILVDRVIFTIINKKMLDSSDFIEELGGIYLDDNGKKKFIQMFEERLSTTITHRRLKRKISYQGIIRMELYKLEKHLLEDVEYKPFISNW